MLIDRDGLLKWLRNTRWWPKNSIPTSYSAEQVDNYIFLWISDSNGARYFIPLKEVEDFKALGQLEHRALKTENAIFVEAELVEPFLINARNVLECEYLHELSCGVSGTPTIVGDSSNIVTVVSTDVGRKVVLKSYRRISSQNNEVDILRYLESTNFTGAPRLYAICGRREAPIGIALEHVEGVDGGYPFYSSLVNTILGKENENVQDLGYEAGSIIARLHLALATKTVSPFDHDDFNLWSKRIEYLSKNLLTRIDVLHGESIVGGLWLELADKRIGIWVEVAIELMQVFCGLKKILCHQDLHLGQMVYSTSRGFVITDFEGEHLALLEGIRNGHGFRDIASAIRSLDYIVFSGVSKTMGMSVEETAVKFIRSGWGTAGLWRNRHSSAILKGYAETLSGNHQRILGLNPLEVDVSLYLIPWYTYRILYEALYEATYRPNNLPIPLHVFAWEPRDAIKGIGV